MAGVTGLKRKYRQRNQLEIFVDMLEVLRFGSYSKWKIMRKANVSNTNNKEYFTKLMYTDCICYNSKVKKYAITNKGLVLLQCIKDLLKMLALPTRGKENGYC